VTGNWVTTAATVVHHIENGRLTEKRSDKALLIKV
jgi:hypothetical protein